MDGILLVRWNKVIVEFFLSIMLGVKLLFHDFFFDKCYLNYRINILGVIFLEYPLVLW